MGIIIILNEYIEIYGDFCPREEKTVYTKIERKKGARNLIFWLKVQNIYAFGLIKPDFLILAKNSRQSPVNAKVSKRSKKVTKPTFRNFIRDMNEKLKNRA